MLVEVGTPTFWESLFSAISATAPIVTTVILAIFAWASKVWAEKARKKADKRAIAIQEVKTTLETVSKDTSKDLESIKHTAEQTHVLVNSQRGVILKDLAVLSRKYATIADKTARLTNFAGDRILAEAAEEAAVAAERDYDLYQHQQGIA